MKTFTSLRIVPVLAASLLFAIPTTSRADRHHGHDHHGYSHYNHGHHNHRSYSYRSYGYRPYYYRPYTYSYVRPYYYSPPSIALGFSWSNSPRYYNTPRTYVAPRYSSDSLAADVQRELSRRGYYRGYIDGDIGPASRSAIQAYQYDRGLAATGRIDNSLLRSLGID